MSHHHHHPRPEYVQEEFYERERVYAPPPACEYERVGSGRYYEGERYGHHGEQRYYEEERHSLQRNERLGELGAVAAGGFALYEAHKAKTDPCNASRHNLEAGAGAIGALASGGYAYHEHRKEACNERFYE
ncbi:hypothetical protein KP509_31G001100 [Ceratopteris richardii]|uniref:Uncharacterized protein n=1 Tax=Ceratopteris richardii TaxID=49495 RepID=A0A8T2QUY0_CERRI|nr:hypothetical protein KP509_31G001100 [Ceratopteris richardii]